MEEDDIDIEGDFDLKPTALSDAGDDDLPSKSAHLQPEFSQHPWVLEQGWTLDNGIDEKSKAVIEKMLQEEQFYIDGKTTEVNVPVVSPTRPPNKPLSHKKQWTEEEKDMFFKGLEMFGHSWSKISSLIPTRSSQQVKYFAHQHLKQKTKSSLLMKPQSRISQSVHQMLLSVTTAQPTVASLMPKGKRAERKLNMPQKQRLPKSRLRKEERTKTNTTGGVTVSHSLEVIRINNVSEGSSDEEIDVIDTDDTDDTATGLTTVSGPDLGQSRHDLGDVDSRENHTDIGESGGIDKVNCDEIDTETQAEHDSVTKIYTRQCVGDDTSVGSDTTNKNQTCGETDCIVRTVSGTVDEIYPVAEFFSESNTSCATMDTLCGCSSAEVHNISHSHCYSVSDSEHFTEIDPLLSLSPCHEASVTCDDTVAGMTGCPGTTWVDPRLLVTEVEGGVSCLPDKTAGLIPGGVSDLGERGTQEQASREQGEPDPCERRCCVQEKMHCDGVSDATAVSRETGNTEGVSDDDEEHLDEYAVVTSSGDAVYMANPTSEVKLDIEVISEQEKLIHSEFFDNRPGLKTPDRYLRIRTFIIDSWRRCKPNYLTKTSVRPGLRNCGDVNCIGRIHSYLEQLGAINFGCSQVQYNRPVRAIPTKVTKDVTSDEQQQCVVAERLAIIHARKRRVRDEHGNWVDEGDLEGKTIQHDNIPSGSQQTSKSTKVRRLYDPFLLVPCQRFSLTHPAPFHVVIEYSGLLTMDVHAHLSKTEVIGLLGGEYSSERGELHVTMAEPCDSISTGMQCEMDPVSQTEASDAIRSTGQAVVGWYHSHPTFAPNPSVRDLETQHKFQGWFAKGGSPFIGVIVNPYNKQTSSPQSQFRCLIVCSEEDISTSHTNTGVPYEFNFESSHRHWNDDTVITQVTRLTQTYSSYVNRVNLLQPMTSTRNFTFLEKIVQSVEPYLPEEHRTDPDRSLMSALSNTMTQLFTNCDTL